MEEPVTLLYVSGSNEKMNLTVPFLIPHQGCNLKLSG
jgi:hypothetical protein